MSKVCQICGKGPSVGNLKSHSNRKTKRRIHANLQCKIIDGKRTKICTRCLKTKNKKNK
ncbi:50S ribosomal protein L28 [Patescibacteria group bacterium]|nr:50S ribosomal protein L28 [Patescibacteria group bacterium]